MPSAWPCAALAVFLIAALLYRSMSDGASEMTIRIVTSAGPLAPAPKVVPQELVAPLVHTADFAEHPAARASSLPPPPPPPPPSPSPRVRWCEHLAKPDECDHWYWLAQQMQQSFSERYRTVAKQAVQGGGRSRQQAAPPPKQNARQHDNGPWY